MKPLARVDELVALLDGHSPTSRIGIVGCRACGVWGRDPYVAHLRELMRDVVESWAVTDAAVFNSAMEQVAEDADLAATARTASACAAATAVLLNDLSPLTLPDLGRRSLFPTPA